MVFCGATGVLFWLAPIPLLHLLVPFFWKLNGWQNTHPYPWCSGLLFKEGSVFLLELTAVDGSAQQIVALLVYINSH